ncbi:MAG: CRISPR-associated helicase Cas3' [Candidatus Methylophosphatis roskildensis]
MKPTEDIPLAHIGPDGERHSLAEHLREVARRAGENAALFDASDWGRLAGIWHDLGKYRSGFQAYIRQSNGSEAHIEGKVAGREKTHSAAGAIWAQRYLPEVAGRQGEVIARILAYVIAGHHAGLDNWEGGLKARLASSDSGKEFDDAMGAVPAPGILRPELPAPDPSRMPADATTGIPGSFALWVRMLFSALVDADFLDTEAFMNAGKSAARDGFASLDQLSKVFDAHMQSVAEQADPTPVNIMRAGVLRQCRDKAPCAPGVFTLTVPTGGGKTLSSLAFALRHAVHHSKRRVIYAIPYTSIIEQTADIFRGILGQPNVVEHHSNAESDPAQETSRSRLACENWDAPLIVTTNVQLLESLFARRTSRCRKLHNLVGSVIVLDEAQLLPVEFLQPILDVLRLLVADYGVTLLLCTATQPALTSRQSFDPRRGLRGFAPEQVTEIIDDVPTLYATLKRVEVHRPTSLETKRDWPDIAREFAQHDAVLAIVNRRADARELYGLVRSHDGEGLWHLSALMCPEHRSDTIAAIKQSLDIRREALTRGEPARPVRVVSTQLVEAGVDMDFPVVFRAMAGLDSIAQAAGRCNREGRLARGRVHVFVPPTLPPPGLLRQAESTCRTIWHGVTGDPLDLQLFPPYFRRLYADGNLDKHGICDMLRVGKEADVRFRDASERFRLIDNEDSGTVIVRYPVGNSGEVDQWVAMLERDGPQRWLIRKLQRFGVTIYQYDIRRLLNQGDIREAGGCPGLYLQVSDVFYDSVIGATLAGAPGDPANLVIWLRQ